MSPEPVPSPSRAEFRLLGPVEVRIGGHVRPLGGSRQEKLLATLLLNTDGMITAGKLVDALWDEHPPDTARNQVHNAIAALRRNLGPARDVVVTDGAGYRAQVDESQVDVHRFTHAVEHARRQADTGEAGAAVDRLTGALRLWRGPALAGIDGRFAEASAARLDDQRLAARELLAELRLATGDTATAIPELTELVADHPLRENLRRLLILALYRGGRQSDALDLYDRTRALLADELGLDPGPELRELHQQVLRGDPGLDQAPMSAEHPVDTRRTPSYLPHDVADFTGRTTEVSQVLALAGSTGDTAVVITALDGMAGIGKTTLAIRVAHLLAGDYPDGQMFLDLLGHTPGQSPLDPATALDTLLRALGVPPEQIPDGLGQREIRWRSELTGRRILVVLDNAADSPQVRALLPGGQGSCVLVTSRRRLSTLEGATSFSLDLMPRDDAIALFRRVAGHRRTEVEVTQVEEVVSLCGFLPLAIRIAASRFHHRPIWTVAYLAGRLRDERRRLDELAVGDRSVMAAFTVSYQHLTDPQRRLFRLLGLHPGPDFDAHGAAALADIAVAEAESLLEDLLDVHLLNQHTVGRYHFHDLLRQHAFAMAEQEEPPGEQRIALRRLVEHYLNVGCAVERLVDPGRQLVEPKLGHVSALPPLRNLSDVKGLVAAEHRTFAAAIGCARAQDLPGQASQLAIILGPCLLRHGYVDEALVGYEQGLDAARGSSDVDAESTLHRSLGVTYIGIGRFHDALRSLREGLTIERARGDGQAAARFLVNIGIVHIRLGQYEDAITSLRDAVNAMGTDGTPRDRAAALGNLGVVHTILGRYTEAAEYHLDALAINTEQENRYMEASCLLNLGWTHTRWGRQETAETYLDRALALSRQLGSKEDEGRGNYLLADCLHQQGRDVEALDRGRAGLVLAREIRSRDMEIYALNVLGRVHHALCDASAAEECYRRALALTDQANPGLQGALANDGLGHLAAQRGDYATALSAWGRGLGIAAAVGLPEADRFREQISAIQRDPSAYRKS